MARVIERHILWNSFRYKFYYKDANQNTKYAEFDVFDNKSELLRICHRLSVENTNSIVRVSIDCNDYSKEFRIRNEELVDFMSEVYAARKEIIDWMDGGVFIHVNK